jgi:ABC-type multidrug transport system fused ATPase/permease subunit
LVFASIALVFSSAAQLAQPMFFGKIITTCSSDHGHQLKDVNRYSIMLLVILAVGGIFTTLRGWLFTLVGERLVRNLRTRLFEQIIVQDIAFFDTNKTGELMNRLSSDTAVVQSCLSVNISMGLKSMAEVFVSIVLLFITSWKLTLVMMAVVPVLVIIVALYGRFTRKLTKDYQDALARAADTGSESIGNARVMKSFGGEMWELRSYVEHIQQSYRKGAKKSLAYGIFAGGIGFLAGLAILVVVYFGATLVINGDLAVGDLTAFVLYSFYIAIGLGVFSSLYTEFNNALGASER